jgi:hypothetical protein
VRAGQDFSVDQVLVPGRDSGYNVVNAFDTGTINNDPDVDPGQVATNLEALGDDNVAVGDIIICVSDHEDSGQNEPYVADGLPGEVAAKNRPIIQPTVASLGQSAIAPLQTYKMGLGYSVEQWYSEYTITDSPAFTLDWTDPMAFLDNPDGSNTPSHLSIPSRIAGPVFDSTADGPGVLRVNDIDTAGELFANPHFEQSNYGQTDVFNVAGDAQSFCLGGPCAGLISFGTQGDLPVSWSLKPSLAMVSSLRKVEFTDDDFRAWDKAWQDYYAGTGAKPTLPLTPGTNSPTPRVVIIVNPPEVRPPVSPGSPAAPQAPVTTVTNNTTNIVVDNSCVSNRVVKIKFPKSAKSGSLRYNGRTVKARRSHGRLRATANLRGMKAPKGSYATVIQRSKSKSGKASEKVRLYKLC